MQFANSQSNLIELTGWFLKNSTVNMKISLVKEIAKLKIYPYFILQVLLLSDDLKLVNYGL